MATIDQPKWAVEKIEHDVFVVNVDLKTYSDKFTILVQSDEHWDNDKCDRKLLKKHHEEALALNAPIFKFGDTFCAMQGKWDKRSDQAQLRDEHRGNNYLDKLVDTATEWYKPYANNIAVITEGNHEGSIMLRHQTSLLDRLCSKLGVHHGAYCGFVKFRFTCHGKRASRTLFWHHGYGGGGEVTRGAIDHSRTRGQYRADIYVSGHIHRRNSDENVVTMLSDNNKILHRQELFLRSSTYKDESKCTYHLSNGRAARPLGGWWVTFKMAEVYTDGSKSVEMEIAETRAT